MPDAGGDARRRRDHHHRGARHAGATCIRCRPRSSKHDGFQCGYCTPGQICSAVAMLRRDQGRHPEPRHRDSLPRPQLTEAEIRERMSGNICRCGAYSNIVEAITEVAGRQA